MKKTIFSIFVVFLCPLLALSGQTLEDLKAIYERELRKIEAACSTGKGRAVSAYGSALRNARAIYEKAGDFEATKAAMDEERRLAAEKSVPESPPAGSPALLIEAHATYKASARDADAHRGRRTVALSNQYVAGLRAIMKRLLPEGKMNEAEAVNAEIKRIEFVMAQAEAAQPPPITPVLQATAPSQPAISPVEKGLVLYYAFDRDEGRQVSNQCPGQNHGENRGASWTPEGKKGGAFQFSGKTAHLFVPTTTDLAKINSSSDFTVAFWARTTQEGSRNPLVPQLVEKRALGGWGDRVFFFSISKKGVFTFGFVEHDANRYSDIHGETRANDGAWHLVVGRKAGGTYELFVDGEIEGTLEGSGSQASSDGITVGARRTDSGGPTGSFVGFIDEMKIWNRALSPAEIEQLARDM